VTPGPAVALDGPEDSDSGKVAEMVFKDKEGLLMTILQSTVLLI